MMVHFSKAGPQLQGGRVVMRLRSNAGVRVCALVSVVVVSILCFTAGSALALSPERHYELVSPVFKGGYGAEEIDAVAADGESVAFYSPGAFAGAPAGSDQIDYVARRGLSGWSTAPLMPPPSVSGSDQFAADVSPSLDSILVLSKPGPNHESAAKLGTEFEFLLHSTGLPDTSENWEVGGMALKALIRGPKELRPGEAEATPGELVLDYNGASADFCHILFNASIGQFLLPEALASGETPIYELDRGCNGGSVSLHVVALDNKGKGISPKCSGDIGIGETFDSEDASSYNAIADGGEEVFVTTCTNAIPRGSPGAVNQLFVRLGAAKTLEVSRPLVPVCHEVPCPGSGERASANFVGASEDGSRVFFTTAAPLTAGDGDAGNDLYMAEIGCGEGGVECGVAERVVTSLVQVSHDPTSGEAAEVLGVVGVAPDGSRAYFVARGVLSGEANAEGDAPVKGADNLYVYEPAPDHEGQFKTSFIGDLCSGQARSGTIADVHCPSGAESDTTLWVGTSGEAQTAGADGGFLVFSTYAQLTGDDTDTAKDVYRYDAATGMLDRVSVGEAGADANGNNSLFDATIAAAHRGGGAQEKVRFQYEMNNRAVSEDGSRIVFRSSEPLSPAATNGLANVYEWHQAAGGGEGSVSLISSGSAEASVDQVVISPDGANVFFSTVQGLVAQDTDGAPDIYDARLGEGFPVPSLPAKPCSGDACQGPLTNPAPLLIPGSVAQAPGGNFAAPTPTAVKAKTKAKKKKKKKKKKKPAKNRGKRKTPNGGKGRK
jgi:hypothetical protein